uniref:Ald_Xan_dh_C2 domain-containing protein n=1 Tax=Macrostomum lignano TaxID=282301 RepID=A0A1I8FS00_9PLAT
VEGQLVINEQAHFSIETLTASVATTEEGLVSRRLTSGGRPGDDAVEDSGPARNQIRVVSPRIGGGFGGKLLMIDLVAAACAVASDSLGRPVRMYMSLGPTLALAMEAAGMLLALPAAAGPDEKLRATSLGHQQRGGYTLNMQAMLADELKHSIDSAFFCPSYRLSLKQMRTDRQREHLRSGPGRASARLACQPAAHGPTLDLGASWEFDPIEFKYRNLYSDGQRMWRELHQAAEVEKRLAELPEFNKNNRFRKRGLDMSASSYNIFYDRRPALPGLGRQRDAEHGGAEMGQGIGVKAAQQAAAILEIDINLVKIKATDSHVLLRKNGDRKGSRYSSTGVGVTEAEVDILTGRVRDPPSRPHDGCRQVAQTPASTSARLRAPSVTLYDSDSAKNLTDGTWNYKVPQAADIRRDLRVHVLRNSPNEAGVLSTKAIGEPPICLAATCVTAVKRAIEAFREQTGKPKQFLAFDRAFDAREGAATERGVSAADRVIRAELLQALVPVDAPQLAGQVPSRCAARQFIAIRRRIENTPSRRKVVLNEPCGWWSCPVSFRAFMIFRYLRTKPTRRRAKAQTEEPADQSWRG